MSETVLRSGPSRGTAFSAGIGGIVKRRLVAAMREQISIFISIEACEVDVFQYCVMRPQQILGLAAVAMSLDKNFGHLREKPQFNAGALADWCTNSGIYLDYPDARILAFADWLKSVVARIQTR
jgi:hypothetical protein